MGEIIVNGDRKCLLIGLGGSGGFAGDVLA